MRVVAEVKNFNLLANKKIYGWIVNIDKISCYYDTLHTLEEVEKIVEVAHQNNQKVYVNARRIIHEQDIDIVINLVKKLEALNVDYYFYGDLAFYEIADALGITSKLIYQVNTYMTNSMDISVMLEENKSVVVSTEISFEELKKVVNGLQEELYIHVFGYYPIFHSRRELISNYLFYRKIPVDLNHNFDVVEELRESHYPIEQNENGMVVYIDGTYVLTTELQELNRMNQDLIGIVLSKNIDLEDYSKVLDLYTSNGYNEYDEVIKSLNIVTTKGLLYEQSKLLKKEGGMVCE